MDCSTPGLPVHHQLPELAQNSCPSSQWCHPATSSPVISFSSCPWAFPASRSSSVIQFFTSGGQSIGASASVLPMNIQDWFPLGWTSWISLHSKGLSRVFSTITVWKHQLGSIFFPCVSFLVLKFSSTFGCSFLHLYFDQVPSFLKDMDIQIKNSINFIFISCNFLNS